MGYPHAIYHEIFYMILCVVAKILKTTWPDLRHVLC